MVELLRQLSDLNGVAGNEKDVRDFILSEIKPYADEIRIDNIGSIIAFKKGKNSKKTLMITAHMDEVGFIVSGITDDGFLKFKAVGSIDTRNIISKCVKINNTIDGVVGMKAIHLQKKEEREATVSVKDLYIDIGAHNKEAAQKRVKLGDYVSFSAKSFTAGEKICGKALDGRSGCACLIELIKKEYDNDIYFLFTAQREIGMRGAMCAAYGIEADCALVLEGVESADMYGCEDNQITAVLGDGVCVNFIDKYAIADRQLSDKFYKSLEKSGIKAQLKKNASGLTDTGAVQRSESSIATLSIAVPVRYSHTQSCMIDRRDLTAMYKAAELFIEKGGDEF